MTAGFALVRLQCPQCGSGIVAEGETSSILCLPPLGLPFVRAGERWADGHFDLPAMPADG